jgi:hypothetical protein
VVLTDKQVSTLDICVKEFQATDYEDWEQIINGLLDSFKSASSQGLKFDRASLKTVCTQSATLGCFHTFLAYLLAPLQQGQTSAKGIHTQCLKLGG